MKEGENSDEDDEEDMTSPLPSILKKPKPLKKEIMEESRVEISPGLFTKRPSKSSETVEKVQEEIKEQEEEKKKEMENLARERKIKGIMIKKSMI